MRGTLVDRSPLCDLGGPAPPLLPFRMAQMSTVLCDTPRVCIPHLTSARWLEHTSAEAPRVSESPEGFDGGVQVFRQPSCLRPEGPEAVLMKALQWEVRKSQHPLPHGDVGKHVVNEVRRAFGHPPPATARTKATAPARDGDEPFRSTVPAAEPREAAC